MIGKCLLNWFIILFTVIVMKKMKEHVGLIPGRMGFRLVSYRYCTICTM